MENENRTLGPLKGYIGVHRDVTSILDLGYY